MKTRRKARNESNPQKLAYNHLNAQAFLVLVSGIIHSEKGLCLTI